jgi:hypothetical protein
MTVLPQLQRELSLAARRVQGRSPRRGVLRFGRRSLVAIPIVLIALGGLALAATHTFDRSHRPFAQSQYRFGHCPTHVIDLGPDALAQARRAALRQAHLAYPNRDLRGTYTTGAHVVTRGSERSIDAQRCGLIGRTILVDLHLPAPFNSASLSEGAVYVSRVHLPDRAPFFELWGLEH